MWSGEIFLWLAGTLEWLENPAITNFKIISLVLTMCLHFVFFTLLAYLWRKEIKEYLLVLIVDED